MTRGIAVLDAALFLLATPFAAHDGHTHKTMGVVSSVHENQLEVTDLNEQKKTFTLDQRTKILRGKTTLTSAEIKVGGAGRGDLPAGQGQGGEGDRSGQDHAAWDHPVTTKTAGR